MVRYKDLMAGIILWVLWGLLWPGVVAVDTVTVAGEIAYKHTYNFGELLSLRSSAYAAGRPTFDLPHEIKQRRRGRRAGVQVNERRRRFKPVLPSVIMGNVQSIVKKMDELAGLVSHNKLFRTVAYYVLLKAG